MKMGLAAIILFVMSCYVMADVYWTTDNGVIRHGCLILLK